MSREDVLRAIRDAEIAAKVTLDEAKTEASEIVTKARLAATEIIQHGRSDSEASSQGKIAEARSVAEQQAGKVSKEGDSSIKSIHDGGEGSRERAVSVVLDSFRS